MLSDEPTPEMIAAKLTAAQRLVMSGVVRRAYGQTLLCQGETRTLEALERKGLTNCLSSLTPLGLAVRDIIAYRPEPRP